MNYAKDKDIQALGGSLVAVASTIIEGARFELLYQHDPLGLSQEIDYVIDASTMEDCSRFVLFEAFLKSFEEDPGVMERVRERARCWRGLRNKCRRGNVLTRLSRPSGVQSMLTSCERGVDRQEG